MKISFLINKKSPTSVPLLWAHYMNTHTLDAEDLKVNVFTLRRFLNSVFSIKKSCDIMHGHHAKSMFAFLLLNRIWRLPSVYTIHGSYLFLSSRNKKLTCYIFENADHIVFVNQYLYDVLPEAQKRRIANKYSIILNGVDYDYKYQKIDIYNTFDLSPSDKIYFHPARFVEEKNHIELIYAFAKVVQRDSDAKLVLAGDGKLKELIKKTIADCKLENHVKLLGMISRDEVYNFLNQCQVFLMPSISEGLNVSFLEAFSQRCNILVSDIVQFTHPLDHHNINPDNNHMILVDPNNRESMENGLIEALSFQPLEKDNMDYSFSLRSMVKSYKKLYSNLVTR